MSFSILHNAFEITWCELNLSLACGVPNNSKFYTGPALVACSSARLRATRQCNAIGGRTRCEWMSLLLVKFKSLVGVLGMEEPVHVQNSCFSLKRKEKHL